jgi:hypothetical protein
VSGSTGDYISNLCEVKMKVLGAGNLSDRNMFYVNYMLFSYQTGYIM